MKCGVSFWLLRVTDSSLWKPYPLDINTCNTGVYVWGRALTELTTGYLLKIVVFLTELKLSFIFAPLKYLYTSSPPSLNLQKLKTAGEKESVEVCQKALSQNQSRWSWGPASQLSKAPFMTEATCWWNAAAVMKLKASYCYQPLIFQG